MALRPLLHLLRRRDSGAFIRIMSDWRALTRLHFLHAALESGLLEVLSRPQSREDLLAALDVRRPELLDALLEMGIALGEIRRTNGRLELRGSRARALSQDRNDALAALIQANVTYYNDQFRHLAKRLRGSPLDEGVREIGPLVARVSKIAEPFVEHFLTGVVRERRPQTILDVGSGASVILRAALTAAPSARGVGLEVDLAVAGEGRENLQRWGMEERAEILVGEVLDPPDQALGPFDLALLFNVVYYFGVEERIAVFRAVRAKLGSQGAVAVTTSCRGVASDLFAANLNVATTSMEGLTPLPTPEEIESQLRNAGFTSVRIATLVPGTGYLGFLAC